MVSKGGVVAVKNCRSVKKRDLKLNDALPKIEVDPETYVVRADGVHLTCERSRCSRWRSVISYSNRMLLPTSCNEDSIRVMKIQ